MANNSMESTPATSFSSKASSSRQAATPATTATPHHRPSYQPSPSLPQSLPSPSHSHSQSHTTDSLSSSIKPAAELASDNDWLDDLPASDSSDANANADADSSSSSSSSSLSSDKAAVDPETRKAADAQDEAALNEAHKAIWDHFCGQPLSPYPSFHFVAGQRTYQRLWDRLAEKPYLVIHFEEEIRRDWNADTGNLVLRFMPSFTHDFVEDGFKVEAADEMKRMAQEHTGLRPFIDRIRQCGHAEIKSYGYSKGASRFEKSPDGQWHYIEASPEPGAGAEEEEGKQRELTPVLFEVAFSEREKHVLEKATEYLTERPGSTVITIKIDYATPKQRAEVEHGRKATVTIWTSSMMEDGRVLVQGVKDETTFRHGRDALPGELSFPFKLFCPPRARQKIPDELQDIQFRISFERLAQILNDAEDTERSVSTKAEPKVQKLKGVVFRSTAGDEVADLKSTTSKRPLTESDEVKVPVRKRRSTRLNPAGEGEESCDGQGG